MVSEKEISRLAFWGILSATFVYMVGWSINVMEVDAAQYAAMSLEMLKKGEYLMFTDQAKEYLDKPPLIFWVSGLSMSLFGANNIAYRIPAFLATILALYSTYRFTLLFYSKQTAFLAALILATLQATFLINHDVRTDTNLMACYIFSLWQLAQYLQSRQWINLILGFTGVGLAMLAKGPIGLIAPAMGVFGHLLLRREWKYVFNPAWIIGLLATLLVLAPMTYGLYNQFDLHPEKLVNGQTGVSGVRFFYWTQSFGRITGESVWDNGASPLFLSHSTLWAFAPWSLFLVLGLAGKLQSAFRFRKGRTGSPEFITLFGFLLPFMALSASRYQLPHYAFVVYPLGAVLTADFIIRIFYDLKPRWSHGLYVFQIVLLYLVLVLLFCLVWLPFPEDNFLALVLFAITLGLFTWVVAFLKSAHKLVLACTILIIGFNAVLNSHFYPNILQFQAGSELGKKAKEDGVKEGQLYSYQARVPNSLNFYSGVLTDAHQDFDTLIKKRNCWIYTNESALAQFKIARPDVEVVARNGDFPVSMLKGKFLNPTTRETALEKRILLKLN
jgi:4-amino-4-deoxy-L-arabinose transferase-like glycosyltransferase